jgi:hypothetical protein
VDGFDPLVEEVQRLNSLGLPGHKYHNYFVVGGTRFRNEESIEKQGPSLTTMHLTSASEAQDTLRAKGTSYTQKFFNSGKTPTFAKDETTVDDFLSTSALQAPDFLKIDTDGHDYFVLQGSRGILSDFRLQGVQVECQFHAAPEPHQNTFSNIDELLIASAALAYLTLASSKSGSLIQGPSLASKRKTLASIPGTSPSRTGA